MKVIFSYGKKVEPGQERLKAFTEVARKFGAETVYVPYDFESPADERAAKLLEIVRREDDPQGLVLVGSSMGSYGALLASMQIPVAGLFLISPALFMYDVTQYRTDGARAVEMVVGWKDTVIPRDKVLAFAREQEIETLVVNNDHAMFDSLPTLTALFEDFLRRLQ